MVAEDLLRLIREKTYAVGDLLPKMRDLMVAYDVGYGVIREAMQQLVALGVVDVRKRRGAVVIQAEADLSLDDATLAKLLSDQAVDELYELRRLVEVAAAGQAAERATPDQVRAIRAAQERVERATGVDALSRADVALHAAIAEASGNAVYVKVLDSLKEVLAGVRTQVAAHPGAFEAACIEHAAVADAIAEGDEAAARRAMETHIDTAKVALAEARAAMRIAHVGGARE